MTRDDVADPPEVLPELPHVDDPVAVGVERKEELLRGRALDAVLA